MSEQETSLAHRLRDGAAEIIVNLSEVSMQEYEVMMDIHTIFLECARTIETLESALKSSQQHANNLRDALGELSEQNESMRGDVDALACIKQMQTNANNYIIVAGVEATVDQLEARVALCVKACTNMSNDALEYIGNVRSEGLFRYKKRHEEIVIDLEQKYEKLLRRHESLGIRYDAAYADLQRYDVNYPPFDISEIITQEQAHLLENRVDELSEVWVDEHGTHWDPPTAWAYAQVCRVKNEQHEEIEKLHRENEHDD
jgi:hypothetical protein